MFFLKKFCTMAVAVLASVTIFAGCYSAEERAQAKAYEKQGKKNAENYIKEKYGFEAKVTDAVCQRLGEFDPSPSESVFVTMEYDGRLFLVKIDGDVETTEGVDNYQCREIGAALEKKLEEVTGLTTEEAFAVYGAYKDYGGVRDKKNGLVAPYFDGTNFTEVFNDGYERPSVVVSYINQELETIDVDAVKKAIGVEVLLFADYDSKAHYETITQPWYNAEGTPIDWDIKRHIPYINEYLTADSKETVYTNCEKKGADGILLVTENREEAATAEKISGFTGGFEKDGYKLISDVYRLETDSAEVRICIPAELFGNTGKRTPGILVRNNGKSCRTFDDLTDDGKFVSTTVDAEEYEGPIEFAVYVTVK